MKKTNQQVLALSLILVTAISLPFSALAQGKAKPAAASAKSSKTHAVEPKPILDEAAKKEINEVAKKLDPETRKNMNQLAENMEQEDKTIYNEVRDEEELALTDIGMLWEAAVERSGTIRYAIEKLSRRDATGKPVEGDNFSKRMLGSLVHLGGVAGSMWTGTPAGLIGSGMIQDLMSGNPTDSALARVTDADMVILAKEVEELQNQLITLYYNYKHSKERLSLAQEAQSTMLKYGEQAELKSTKDTEALKPLMQSLMESARQEVQNAEQALSSNRSALSGVVGPTAIAALDQSSPKNVSLGN
ncbi:hypothetical protein [Vampirovibrio sp.]|uniref:hypothetical protein n=1 Tax=Vampirovibrio sp. TaxID=2717857 RepID=UPI0035945499